MGRVLIAAALAVGFAIASPAAAQSPKFELMDNAWAKKHAQQQVRYFGWTHSAQWQCLSSLWGKESGWRLEARNNTPVRIKKDGKWIKVHAGGIPQILGMSPKTPAPVQIQRGLVYIKTRYGSPCAAWNWWSRHNWY